MYESARFENRTVGIYWLKIVKFTSFVSIKGHQTDGLPDRRATRRTGCQTDGLPDKRAKERRATGWPGYWMNELPNF